MSQQRLKSDQGAPLKKCLQTQKQHGNSFSSGTQLSFCPVFLSITLPHFSPPHTPPHAHPPRDTLTTYLSFSIWKLLNGHSRFAPKGAYSEGEGWAAVMGGG